MQTVQTCVIHTWNAAPVACLLRRRLGSPLVSNDCPSTALPPLARPSSDGTDSTLDDRPILLGILESRRPGHGLPARTHVWRHAQHMAFPGRRAPDRNAHEILVPGH